MATGFATEIITPEQLAAMPNDKDFELVDGQLVERNMGNHASWVALELAHYLREFAREKQLGWVFGAEAGYRLDPARPNLVRKPDVSFVRFGRFPNEKPAQAYDELPPDLAVEVISPRDTFLEVEEKIDEYLRSGVRLVWVVNPELKILKVYRPDGTTATLRTGQIIDGESVVPGFQCPIVELFSMPKPPTPPRKP